MNKKLILVLLAILVLFFIVLLINQNPLSVKIETVADGYSALDVDVGITRQIEEELLQMEEIKKIRCESYNGKSVIYADLYKFANPHFVWDKLQRKIDFIKNDILKDAKILIDDEFSDVFNILVGVSINEDDYEKLYDITNQIRKKYLRLTDTGRAEIVGAQEETLYLYFNPNKLADLKVSPPQLLRIIDNMNSIKGAGIISSPYFDYELNSDVKINGEEDLRKILFNVNGVNLPLASFFTIEKTIKTPLVKEICINGKVGLLIALSVKKGENTLFWRYQTNRLFKQLLKEYKNVKLTQFSSFCVKPLSLSVKLKNGSSFYETKKSVQEIENLLKNKQKLSFIGISPPRFSRNFYPYTDRQNAAEILVFDSINSDLIKEFVSRKLPKVKFDINASNNKNQIEIIIFANTIEELFATKKLILSQLSKINEKLFIIDNWGDLIPEYKISINQNAALMSGVSPEEIFDFLQTFYNGKLLTRYYRGENIVSVVLRGNDNDIRRNDLINSLYLYSDKTNSIVPISGVAKIKSRYTYSGIYREDGQYSMRIRIQTPKTGKKQIIEILNNLGVFIIK